MSTLLGLDLGVSAMKLAVGDRSGVSQIASVLLPSDLVRDHKMVSEEAVAQEVKHALREQHMKKRPCAVVIPAESAIVRRLTVPYMSPEQLRVNLPYEFHDFVQGDKDQYFYDYAVVAVREGRKGEDGKEEPPTLDLLAAATRKETIAAYRRMLRLAGMKLVRAVPECLAYGNLLRAKLEQHPEEYRGECAVVDLGHQSVRLHIYQNGVYDTTRTIELGGRSLDAIIADTAGVDPHLATGYKMSNYQGAQEISACRELYSRVAVEIMRAVNFYGFNTPDSDLRDLYLSGGLANVTALREELERTLQLTLHPIDELCPGGLSGPETSYCAAAMGVLLQGNGR